MKQILILFLLVAFSATTRAADTIIVRKQLLRTAARIAKWPTLDDRAIGSAAERTEQYGRFQFLQEKATDAELVELTRHADPKVRAYAFWGLAKRNYAGIRDLLDQHLRDTARIEFNSGCTGSIPFQLRDFFLSVLTPREVDGACYKLSWREVDAYRKKMNAK